MKTAKETDFTSVDFPAPRNPEMIVAGTLFSLSSKVLEYIFRPLMGSTRPRAYVRDVVVVVVHDVW